MRVITRAAAAVGVMVALGGTCNAIAATALPPTGEQGYVEGADTVVLATTGVEAVPLAALAGTFAATGTGLVLVSRHVIPRRHVRRH